MKNILPFIVLLISSHAFAEAKTKFSATDVLTWPRGSADEFGCFLEKEFGHKDQKFNCSLKKYENKGDPEKNTKVYYEGPKFPKNKIEKVNKNLSNIELAWEHGELQEVSLTIPKKLTEKEVKKLFNLPEKANYPRENVMDISIQDCSLKETCILIQGFDHTGAGDL